MSQVSNMYDIDKYEVVELKVSPDTRIVFKKSKNEEKDLKIYHVEN